MEIFKYLVNSIGKIPDTGVKYYRTENSFTSLPLNQNCQLIVYDQTKSIWVLEILYEWLFLPILRE